MFVSHETIDVCPMRIDVRECIIASFGGNCFGAALNRSVSCDENVGCPGKRLQFHKQIRNVVIFP